MCLGFIVDTVSVSRKDFGSSGLGFGCLAVWLFGRMSGVCLC